MKKIKLTFLLGVLLSTTLYAQNNILGKWLTEDKDAIVEIFEENNQYHGKIVSLMPDKNPDGTPILDQYNPDKSKRQLPVLGSRIVHNFEWDGKELVNGKVYDPNNGKYYKGKIWYEDGVLKMRGYIAFLYRTESWTKIK